MDEQNCVSTGINSNCYAYYNVWIPANVDNMILENGINR